MIAIDLAAEGGTTFADPANLSPADATLLTSAEVEGVPFAQTG